MRELISKVVRISISSDGHKLVFNNAVVLDVTDTHISFLDAKTNQTKYFRLTQVEEVTVS